MGVYLFMTIDHNDWGAVIVAVLDTAKEPASCEPEDIDPLVKKYAQIVRDKYTRGKISFDTARSETINEMIAEFLLNVVTKVIDGFSPNR